MITAEQWELTSFFEAEPALHEEGIPWPYVDAVFESQVNRTSVRFEINPACSDVAFSLRGEEFVYELSARALHDVRYRNEGGVETLDLWLTQSHSILVQLCPEAAISEHRTGSWETQFDD